MKNINAFIIEDEIPAQMNLKRILKQNFEDINIIGVAESISQAVNRLEDNQEDIDIIFMDVELSDGKSFEIFKKVEVLPKVIITTAYDNYAITAFKTNCIDYLLKPISIQELKNAVNKCLDDINNKKRNNQNSQLKDLEQIFNGNRKEYKERFAVKIGAKINIINTPDIAYFISENKSSYIITSDSKKYLVDQPLDVIIELLNPKDFFRVSRNCIASITSIASVYKHGSTGKLKITLSPQEPEDIFVSRTKTQDFIKWLNGEEF